MLRRVFLNAVLAAAFAVPLSIGSSTGAFADTIAYRAHLAGTREVPKNDSKGKGTFDATFDPATKVLTYTLTFEGLSGPATVAHLHGPAPRGQNAGVLVPIGKDIASPVSGSATLTDEQVADLKARKIYVNVHTAANPGGEIRGQLYPVTRKKAKAPAKST
jgi:hypothetical protein